MSFYTSLSGLQAAQTEMSTISHNLANVSTNGFKKSRTDFADVIASNLSTDPSKMIGSGVVVKANVQDYSEGNLVTSTSGLDLAISGDGFFAVKTAGTKPQVDYTRNGSFSVDADRYIVDGQGSRLQAFPVDDQGNPIASGSAGLIDLQVPEVSGKPVATTAVTQAVNLGKGASASTGTFNRSDASTYNNSTSTTIFDASGNPETMTTYYARNDDSARTDGHTTWSAYTFVGDQQLKVGGSTAPVRMEFDASGQIVTPTAATNFDTFTPANGVAQTLSVDMSASKSASTVFSVTSTSQNGSSVGQLAGISVDKQGIVIASYSNNDNLKLGKVVLANFSNPTGLRQLGNSYWASTGLSGQPKIGTVGDSGYGNLMSGTLEGSNVDVTEELVDLIAAQRNFQANAKALDTSSKISQTIFNIQ